MSKPAAPADALTLFDLAPLPVGAPRTTRATSQAYIDAYRQTGSVWRAGKLIGVSGQTVSERLRALDYPMATREWTDEEVNELRSLITAGLTAGQAASRLGRSFAGITCKMHDLDMKIVRPTINKPKRSTGYDRASIDQHLRALESNPKLRPTTYARSVGLEIETFVTACQRHFEDRWQAYAATIATIPTKPCPYCGRVFYPTNARQQHCSRKCSSTAKTDADYFGGRRRETVGLAAGVCQLCAKQGHAGLSSHHVYGKDNDPDNEHLVALCAGCHKIVSLLGGRKFVDDPEVWQTLITLAWLRRHGNERHDDGKAICISVVFEIDADADAHDDEIEAA